MQRTFHGRRIIEKIYQRYVLSMVFILNKKNEKDKTNGLKK